MSSLQAKSPTDPQRRFRNWIAETLVVAGILAFGYFVIVLERSPLTWSGPTQQTSEFRLD